MEGIARMIDMVVTLPVAALLVVPLWRIFDRAGLNPLWALTVFIPVIGLVVALAILAFSRWPRIEGEVWNGPTLGGPR